MAFEAGAAIIRIQGDISDFKSKVDDAKKTGAALGDALRPVGAAMTAIGAAGAVAIGAMVKEAMGGERAIARLTQLTKQASGASAEQTQALIDQANALQKIGVIGDDVTEFGQSQLATFALTTDTIATLTPAMLDLAVANKGVNATQEDMINIGNLVGKVMSGQVGALTKYGVSFSAAQEEVLKTGNEMERAATLAEVLGQNFGGLNEAMRETTEGQMASLKNDFGDLVEVMGQTFLPILQQVIETIQPLVLQLQEWIAAHPQLASQIAIVVAAITAFALVLGPILLVIPTIVTAIQILGAVFAVLMGPVGLVIAGIAAIVAIVVLLIKHWDWVMEKAAQLGQFLATVWDSIVSGVTAFLQFIIDLFTTSIEMWISVLSFGLALILGLFGTNFEEVKNFLVAFWNTVKDLFQKGVDFVKAIWTLFWNGLVMVYGPIVTGIVNTVTNLWNGFKALFQSGGEAISNAWGGVWEGIKSTAQTVGNAVIGVVKNIINSIIDKINGFIRAVNKVAQAGSIGGLKIPNIPEIPMLAKGGIVTGPTLAMIGENGPEAVVPLNGSNTPDIGGGTVINIYDPIVRDESDFGRLGELVRDIVGRDLEVSRLGVTR